MIFENLQEILIHAILHFVMHLDFLTVIEYKGVVIWGDYVLVIFIFKFLET